LHPTPGADELGAGPGYWFGAAVELKDPVNVVPDEGATVINPFPFVPTKALNAGGAM